MDSLARTGWLPGGNRPLPARAVLISVLSLTGAVALSLVWPISSAPLVVLPWLLALVPPFLLASHRGWTGAAIGFLAALTALLLVDMVQPQRLGEVDPRQFAMTIALGLAALSLGAGAVAELLHREHERALGMAYIDTLTGLPNRHVLDFFLEKTFAAAQRGRRLALIMWDLDGFKAYNDANGHRAGDAALREVGRILNAESPATLITGRYGGDEFLSILPGDDGAAATRLMSQVRTALASDTRLPGGAFSMSSGMALYSESVESAEELVNLADASLYESKQRGYVR
ncbi:MAG: GGDEF domain-containing protein [Gemmatimonadota bacterium]